MGEACTVMPQPVLRCATVCWVVPHSLLCVLSQYMKSPSSSASLNHQDMSPPATIRHAWMMPACEAGQQTTHTHRDTHTHTHTQRILASPLLLFCIPLPPIGMNHGMCVCVCVCVSVCLTAPIHRSVCSCALMCSSTPTAAAMPATEKTYEMNRHIRLRHWRDTHAHTYTHTHTLRLVQL